MSDEVHAYPVGDLIEHLTEAGANCPCIPTFDPVKREGGSVGWVIVHHSLDGREARRARPLGFWRWVIGVHFLGRPIGWTHDEYRAHLSRLRA